MPSIPFKIHPTGEKPATKTTTTTIHNNKYWQHLRIMKCKVHGKNQTLTKSLEVKQVKRIQWGKTERVLEATKEKKST